MKTKKGILRCGTLVEMHGKAGAYPTTPTTQPLKSTPQANNMWLNLNFTPIHHLPKHPFHSSMKIVGSIPEKT